MFKILNGRTYKLENKKWVRDVEDIEIINSYKIHQTVSTVCKTLLLNNERVLLVLKRNDIRINSHKETIKIVMNSKETKKKCREQFFNSNEKRKKTNLKKFGTEFPSQTKEFKNKVVETSLSKYGTVHFLESKEVRDKIKETINTKYNVDNISQLDSTKQKIIDTNLEKRNVKHAFQDEDVKNKCKQTLLERYNVTNSSLLPEVKIKREETSKIKYGETNWMKLDSSKEHFRNLLTNYFIDNKLDKYCNSLNIKLIDETYINAGEKHNWKCNVCGNIFKHSWNYIQQGYECKICFPRSGGRGKKEIQLFNFLNDNEILIESNNRNIIGPLEIDIFIPKLKIGIEFNEFTGHCDKKNYHLNKTIQCEKQGVHLIHIFEDEWDFKQDIVKNRLLHLLGVSNSERIHARKCVIKEISPSIKNKFLEKYHIQGKDSSSIKLGAFYNNKLVSVMTFSKGNISKGSKNIEGIYELNRFCSNYDYHIPGIAGKLLSHFKRNFKWKEIFSYADRRWSNGNLYSKLGFKLEKVTLENYWYVKNKQRIHRFSLRKRADEPKDIPEWILRQQEGYHRIWDSGSLKYKLTNF